MYVNWMQNIKNNIPTITRPENTLLDNVIAFILLAVSSIFINGIANSFINPYGLDPVFTVCASFSALGLVHYTLPNRSKISVVVRSLPVVLPLSCMLFIMCNRIQHQAHNELIPLNFLGGFYLFSWTPYLMAIYAFRPIFKGFMPKFFK